jgi:hypothetical protein
MNASMKHAKSSSRMLRLRVFVRKALLNLAVEQLANALFPMRFDLKHALIEWALIQRSHGEFRRLLTRLVVCGIIHLVKTSGRGCACLATTAHTPGREQKGKG